jgi:hypothetical protein
VAALALGGLVYALDRRGGGWWGAVAGWLPDLVHPFAFALFTAALLPPSPAWQAGACGFWVLVDGAFECGQHPAVAAWIAGVLPDAAWTAPLRHYFERGTFDVADLAATLAGGLAAAFLLHRSRSWKRHEP